MDPILPSVPDDALDDALLGRYVAGRATVAERASVDAWLGRDPSRHEIVDAVRQVWAVSPLDSAVSDAEIVRVWASVRDRTVALAHDGVIRTIGDAIDTMTRDTQSSLRSSHTTQRLRHAPRSSSPITRRGLWSLAGAAAAGLVAVVGLIRSTVMRQSGDLPGSRRTYASPMGQMAVVHLTDGSIVRLAPGSRLTVAEERSTHARRLTLDGDAHFDIVTNARTPLSVQTGAVVTRVLGTVFDVRYDPSDRMGRVAVYTGKVATGQGARAVVLGAGMVGRFTDSAVVTVTAGTSADDRAEIYTDWARGQLVFRNVPVRMALATLQRWYGYRFRLTDSTLASQHVTAELAMGESAEMLRVMQHILGVHLEFTDSVVTLRPDTNGRLAAPARSKAIYPHATSEVGR